MIEANDLETVIEQMQISTYSLSTTVYKALVTDLTIPNILFVGLCEGCLACKKSCCHVIQQLEK